MPDATSMPQSNWDQMRALRKQRLDLYARVLDVQKTFYELWGRFPTVDEVAKAIEGA